MKVLNILAKTVCSLALLATVVESAPGAKGHKHQSDEHPGKDIGSQNPRYRPQPIPLKKIKSGAYDVLVNTSSVSNVEPSRSSSKKSPRDGLQSRAIGTSLGSTILVLARDGASAFSGYSGLLAYGIPFEVVTVPSTGVTLPDLTTSATEGKYGAIVVLGEVSYDYGAAGFQSALTAAQWALLYQYQLDFGVRMVRIDVYPSIDSGTTPLGGCCSSGDQLLSVNDTSKFPTAGLKPGAGISTLGLWHYPAKIIDSTIATAFLQLAPAIGYAQPSTAGVINNIGNRQQMVFFIPFATDWDAGSNVLQHVWIHWATRGLYAGYRRLNFNTQIDDMFLASDIYDSAGREFRVTADDMTEHRNWVATINAKLPAGSSYAPEIGHNGNGNIEAADTGSNCGIGPIDYAEQIDTPLEFQKPLGSGVNLWPGTPANYPYTTSCINSDPLKTWFATATNRNKFYHLSHTFTHEGLNNATYFDANKEITWNQAWLAATTLNSAANFSPNSLIPPAITGLHNGDAIRAWLTNGITSVVGDNTRPVLRNTNNPHHALTTTTAGNGWPGLTVIPRWATNIYYNCDTPACTVAEWIATAAGSGDFNALLALERRSNTRNLFGLNHDPFMFHQANLRRAQATVVINGKSGSYSIFQAWVETVIAEVTRLVTWPVVTLKQNELAQAYRDREIRDGCAARLSYTVNPTAGTITAVTVTATGNKCAKPIPVTFPGPVTSTAGDTTEKLGSDPLTVWVQMKGTPRVFQLVTPIAL